MTTDATDLRGLSGEATAPLGAALRAAVEGLRAALADPVAPITVVVPAGPNGVLARRSLATQGPVLRVWFETPEGLLLSALPALFWRDRRAEPAGWLRVTLGRALQDLAARRALGGFDDVLVRPGWRDPLVSALTRLEAEGVCAADLTAVVDDADCAAPVRARAALLVTLKTAIDEARVKDGIAAPAEIVAAACAASDEDGVAAARARGAVVLGDRELPFSTFSFLRGWLSRRAVVGVMPTASMGLAAAKLGLVESAGGARVVELEPGGVPPRLRALQQRLFRSGTTTTTTTAGIDRSVVFARTPDDVRECVECVREVQRAIKDGVPLDRIAVVLPDGNQRGALEEALERAGVPCTWLVGAPAKDLVAARLLRVVVDVACGDQTPSRLYELLSHPALNLRAALGPDAVKGRGRWRRMLSRVNRAQGLTRIIEGLQRRAGERDETAGAARDPDDVERERTALSSLIACTRALADALERFRDIVELGGHARAWTSFLRRFARVSESRGRLVSLLEPLCASLSGPALTAGEAREELTSLLEREIATGNLAERSIRVLPPLHLLGGEVDVVCVLGLSERRFPSPATQDAILSDELLVGLSSKLGRALPLARAHEDRERRRFAAAVGAARQRVWLSVPALHFEHERPALASSLALEALSAVLGRRARYEDLDDDDHRVRAGSRARSWPDDADDAVGPLEHIVARAARSPNAALPALASHPTARDLLQLHRSMLRAQSGAFDAWSGQVPVDLLTAPGLDGAVIDLDQLCELVASPGAFFFRHMLGAFSASQLKSRFPPLERDTLETLLAHIASDAQSSAPDDDAVARELCATVMARLDEQRALGAFDDAALAQARPLVDAIGRALVAEAGGFLRRPAHDAPLHVVDGLPWTIDAAAGRVVSTSADTASLVDVATRLPNKHTRLQKDDRVDLVLSALALNRVSARSGLAGPVIDVVQVITPASGSAQQALAKLADDVVAMLRGATLQAQAGLFALRGARAFALVADSIWLEDDGTADDDTSLGGET